jgi:DNA-binding transcriptional regulator YbjK
MTRTGPALPAAPPPGGSGRRTRRHDPDRKARILDAALDVIAAQGVARTTHRAVAARAGVPLGSVTYHFDGLAELLAQAFGRHVEQQSALFEALFAGVEGRERFLAVLVDLVCGRPGRERAAVLGFELHLAALRDPALRTLTEGWTRESRAVLARFTGPDAAARLDDLLEGMILHALLSTGQQSRRAVRDAIARTLDPDRPPAP